MTLEQKQQIANATLKLQEARKLSANKTAFELGINASTLKSVRDQDKWGNLSEDMWRSLYSKLGLGSEWQILQTPNYNLIVNVCADAKNNSRMLSIVGNSGLGKSTALKALSGKLNPDLAQPNTHYVFCNALMTKRKFVEVIAKAVGVTSKGDLCEIIDDIANVLNRQEKPLLVFDDVGKLKWLNHQTIQLIYDLTEGNVGIVLSGTPVFKTMIDKGVQRSKNGFDEYKRRIEFFLELSAPSKRIVAEFCRLNGIDNSDCVKYLQRKVKDYGTLKSLITNANAVAKRLDKEKVDLEVFELMNQSNK